MKLQALSMCICEKQKHIRIFFPWLINCYCSCRKLHVDRQRVSTGVLVSRRRWAEGAHLLFLFKPKSATDGAKKSPVLMNSSSGGGASSVVDVVSTGVVSKGEGGAGAGSLDDVVATGVVNRLGDCKGEGIDMDGVLSDAAEGSGPADRTLCPRSHIFRGITFFYVDGVLSDAADGSGPANRTLCPHSHLLRGITSGCPGACSPTLPINFPW